MSKARIITRSRVLVSSMAGTDVLPAYTSEPDTLKKFLEHLDKSGKTQYNMVSHKMERDDLGRVTGISPEETTCLPLPTTTPSKKKLKSNKATKGHCCHVWLSLHRRQQLQM